MWWVGGIVLLIVAFAVFIVVRMKKITADIIDDLDNDEHIHSDL